ncbi:MAG: hypothetical protein ACYCV7_10010 [Acidimicrobiales bacterium]
MLRNRAGATDAAAFGPGPLSASPSPHDGSPTANRVDRETTDRMDGLFDDLAVLVAEWRSARRGHDLAATHQRGIRL